MKKLVLLSILLFISCPIIVAQDFESHIWKERVLVILADSPENKNFKKQQQLLLQDLRGLEERKLVLYLITPSREYCDFDQIKCISNKTAYKRYKKFKSDFEIVLIGLDGGKKIQQNILLTPQQLYDKIDAMPMRARELRKN